MNILTSHSCSIPLSLVVISKKQLLMDKRSRNLLPLHLLRWLFPRLVKLSLRMPTQHLTGSQHTRRQSKQLMLQKKLSQEDLSGQLTELHTAQTEELTRLSLLILSVPMAITLELFWTQPLLPNLTRTMNCQLELLKLRNIFPVTMVSFLKLISMKNAWNNHNSITIDKQLSSRTL